MKKYAILGGLWFDKVNGNTYHNTKIRDLDTNELYYNGFQYGYGSQYRYSAEEYIKNTLKVNDFELIDMGTIKGLKRDIKNGNF